MGGFLLNLLTLYLFDFLMGRFFWCSTPLFIRKDLFMSYEQELSRYAEYLTNNLADEEEEQEDDGFDEYINYQIDIARGK